MHCYKAVELTEYRERFAEHESLRHRLLDSPLFHSDLKLSRFAEMQSEQAS